MACERQPARDIHRVHAGSVSLGQYEPRKRQTLRIHESRAAASKIPLVPPWGRDLASATVIGHNSAGSTSSPTRKDRVLKRVVFTVESDENVRRDCLYGRLDRENDRMSIRTVAAKNRISAMKRSRESNDDAAVDSGAFNGG
jgi:hypothetical protein